MALDLSNQQLTKIEILPNTLTDFRCNDNIISKIENLPNNLRFFSCYMNSITKIENLPNSISHFYCMLNNIIRIENLPHGLEDFCCAANPIEFVDNVDISWFDKRGGFKILWYNRIKHLQRRMKIRYKLKRNNAAKIIQNGCHNWLYSPKCRDGTIGIIPRLDLIKCCIYS